MGGCLSTAGYTFAVTEDDLALHKEAEKLLKEARLASQVKVRVLLLGSGDSGKSTVLKLILKAMDDGLDVKDGEAYSTDYHTALAELWKDESVQQAVRRGNEAALPEK
ncbi:hypothetical protein ONZ45_g10984 [Pleurotus djamor]|nr:hypothetical protein ONZ45_g10984 [Pleurotus djamor]